MSIPGWPLLQRPETFIADNEPKAMLSGLETRQCITQPPQSPPPQINMSLLFFNKALPDQMLTPVMIVQPAEGINSKSPFK